MNFSWVLPRLPWKSVGFHGKCHGSWHFHGKCRLWPRHVAVVLSVATSVVVTMATHGNPRQWPLTLPWQFQRPSAAMATATLQSPEVRGIPRQMPRQFPRTFNQRNFHGYPRPMTSIATAILRYAAISTEVRGSPRLLPQHVPRFCLWQTPSYQLYPRPSGPVAVRLAVGVRGHGRGAGRGCVRGPIHGFPRTFPWTNPWVFL